MINFLYYKMMYKLIILNICKLQNYTIKYEKKRFHVNIDTRGYLTLYLHLISVIIGKIFYLDYLKKLKFPYLPVFNRTITCSL